MPHTDQDPTPAAPRHRTRRLTTAAAWTAAGAGVMVWLVARAGALLHPYLVAAAAMGPLWVITGALSLLRRGRHRWLALTGMVLWGSVAVTGITAARGPVPADGVDVVVANLMLRNTDPDQAVADVLALDADVLITPETTPYMAALIRASGRYPVELQGLDGAADVRIWGRAGAIADGHLRADTKGFPRLVVDGIEIVAIHTTSPSIKNGLGRWRNEYAVLARYVAGRDDLVLAGDFNASLEHRPLQRLGLRPASRAAGVLFPRTWPARLPLIGIDHVLVADAVAVGGYGEFTITGSDHHGVRATVAPVPARQPAQ